MQISNYNIYIGKIIKRITYQVTAKQEGIVTSISYNRTLVLPPSLALSSTFNIFSSNVLSLATQLSPSRACEIRLIIISLCFI